MKIMITGVSGYFARELIAQLLNQENVELVGLTMNPEKLAGKYDRIKLVSNGDLFTEKVAPEIDIVVHTAFCRKSNGKLLVESLNFERNLIHWSIDHGVKGFINLSSQSVFGSEKEKLPDENSEMAPGSLYSLAKCASELLLEEIADKKLIYSNVRLASLVGPSESVPDNVLYKFICSGLAEKTFKVIGGKQNFSFLDVRDAASAVRKIMLKPLETWESAYNLGPEKQINILEMADCVCKKIYELTGKKIDYEYEQDDTQLNAGMDSTRFFEVIQWRPEYSFEKIVEDTIKYVVRKGEF